MDKDTLNDVERFANEASKEIAPQIQSVMTNMQNDANALYVRYANQAAIRASKVGREQALREAVTKLAGERVCAYSYTREDGSTVRVSADVGIRRMINDSMRERQIRQTLNIADRTGVNLVEVNSTSNARPSHAAWQGKIYSINGSTPEYPNFEESCHVGDPVKGIGGYNCGHTVALYHEGFSRVYSDPLEGTGYTTEQVRDLTSQQREYEREIRKEKRIREVLKASGFDTKATSARIKALSADLQQLIDDNSSVLYRKQGYREAIAPILRRREGLSGVVHTTESDLKKGLLENNVAYIQSKHRKLKNDAIIEKCIDADKPVFFSEKSINDKLLISRSNKIKPIDGYYDVMGHGDPEFIELYNSRTDYKSLWKIISSREDYNGEPIRLLSCKTGNVGDDGFCFAQALADYAGVEVIAPTQTLYIYGSGKMKIGGLQDEPEGEMKIFKPRKKNEQQ